MNFKNWLTTVWHQLKGWPWKRIGLISLCSVLSLILIVSIFVTAYVEHLLGLIERPTLNNNNNSDPLPTTEYSAPTLPSDFTGVTIPPDQVTTAPKAEVFVEHEDLINIMLVGQDRRPGENYLTRSDAMILCTFNTKSKTITLTSFMRDLYVTIPGRTPNKMNAAYQFGGMELLRQTMLENFAVKVDAFVEVDFSGFEKVIGIIGDVTITLNQAEADHLNSQYGWNLSAGPQQLNGEQALAYSRIRYVGNSDFERTQRQRNVITAILNQCKSMSLPQAMNMLNQILPLVATDMSDSQITNYAMKLFPLLTNSDMTTQRIPIDGSYKLEWVGALDVVNPNLEINRQYLYDTLMPH